MMQNARWLASGLFFLASIAFSNNVFAVPAAPIVHELIQPDGSRFQARKWGDEWSHGWETVEGYTIMQEAATKQWVYAASDVDGKMVPTARVVGADAVPKNTPQYLRPAGSSPLKALNMSAEAQPFAAASVAPTGTANIPVLLVNFSDTSSTYAASDFSSLLFGTGNHSMKDYYEEVSYGKFSVSAGPAGVRGWYNASKTHDYYGANDSNGDDEHPAELVREAVAAADADIDFSQYDTDGDCYVDVVAIVHQGTGEEASKTATDIWSHRWSLNYAGAGEYTTNDTAACGSIKVNDYIIQPEIYQGGLTTMGVFAHEYGHSLGLPDLYDTDDPENANIASSGIGEWCLMAGGSWNQVSRGGDRPAHLSAWCNYKLGWVNPTVVTGKLVNEQINAASSQADVYRLLTGSPATGGEYFLIENRQQSGFDEGIPGAGLAIWHIDESKDDNTQECKTATGCSTAHYKVALEQADGSFDLENNRNRGDAGDLYFSGKNFTSSTVPNSLLYGGTDHKLSVTNISASGSAMTATLDASSYYSLGRIAAGSSHTVFIRNDGSLWAWGSNFHGQLGDGTTDNKLSPVRIGTENNWQAVATSSDDHTVALKTDGSLWAWGNNEAGQLGDGTTNNKLSPVQIGTDTNWQTIAAGHLHTVAIKTDGGLWVWGWNYSGQLGDGTTEEKHYPVRIATENNWQSVTAGNRNTLALKSDGSLWAWGYNSTGQLGDGTTEDRLSPVRVGMDSDWQTVVTGNGHTVALKSDGSLWAWGYNAAGQLGDGTTKEKYSPVKIGTITDWLALATKDSHNLALKNDGSLWTWGWNGHGQLADGTLYNRLTPMQLGTDTNWQAITTGYSYSVALKNNGTLWAWGENNYGQLGDGTTIERHSPVQVIFTSNSDTDNDGIDDGWEMTYFHNLTTANATTSNADKDGYSDKQEYLNWLAGEQDPNGAVYDPTAKNAPGGTGYQPPGKASFLPAIYKLLLKR